MINKSIRILVDFRQKVKISKLCVYRVSFLRKRELKNIWLNEHASKNYIRDNPIVLLG